MIPTDTLLTFVSASVILSIAPGPDNLFVLTHSAVHGARTGLLVTLGLCSGLVVHTIAVALGVAVIFQTSIIAFSVLKLLGAVYLLYLARQAFKSSSVYLSADKKQQLTGMALYRRGIIMNITNPKVAIFFLAFLPQFVTPANGSVTVQLILLGFVFLLIALLIFSFIAMLAGYLNSWLTRSPQSWKILHNMAGLVFIILALKLVTSSG